MGDGPCLPLPGPSSPHWVSSEQSLQSHTKLHTASLGVLQWLGTQAQPGDPAAASRDSQVAWGREPSNLVILSWGRPDQVEEGEGWVCGWGLHLAPKRLAAHQYWGDVGSRAPSGTPPGKEAGAQQGARGTAGGCPHGQASVEAQAPSSSVRPSPWGLGDQKAGSFPSSIIPRPPEGLPWAPHSLALEPPSALLQEQDLMTHPGARPGRAAGGWAEAWSGPREQGEGCRAHWAAGWGPYLLMRLTAPAGDGAPASRALR